MSEPLRCPKCRRVMPCFGTRVTERGDEDVYVCECGGSRTVKSPTPTEAPAHE